MNRRASVGAPLLMPEIAPLADLIAPIKEEEISEESKAMTEVSSQEGSLKTINNSMSILDNSLNMDPEYTSNNAYIDHKTVQFRWE